jgi:hypothetical protein
MKVTIKDDQTTEMLSIEVDGKQIECGNYWDFNTKRTIIKLLDELQTKHNIDYYVDENTWRFDE